MVYHNHRFSRFDKVMVGLAVVILISALFLEPKESFRIIKTNLTISPAAQEHGALLAPLISRFEEENPNINVSIKNEEPDVVIFAVPGNDGSFTREGPKEYVTVATFIKPLFYNISILEEAGLDRPPKTRDEFIEACGKINAKKTTAFAASGDIDTDIMPWFWSAGIFPEPNWTSKPAVETWTFLKKLHDEKILNTGDFFSSEAEKVKNFTSGNIAFFIGGSELGSVIEKYAPDLKFGVTTIPVPADFKGGAIFNTTRWIIGVSEESEHKDAARLFIEFLKENPALEQSLTEQSTVAEKIRLLGENASLVSEEDAFANPAGGTALFQSVLSELWSGEKTPRECAAAVKSGLKDM